MGLIKKYLKDLYCAYNAMFMADKVVEHVNANDRNDHVPYLVFINRSKSLGLMTYAAQIASFAEYSERKGFYLIVDMKTNPCVNLDDSRVGVDNAWEYYYEQPFKGVPDLDEIYHSCTYYETPLFRKDLLFFYSGIRKSIFYRVLYDKKSDFNVISISNCVKNVDEYKKWCLVAKRYLRLNKKTEDYVENEYKTLLAGKRVLGISVRGTDYARKKSYGHPIQPQMQDVIKAAGEYIEKYEYDYIYFSCEEYKMVQELERAYPGRIIINNRKFFDHIDFERSDIAIGDVHFERENDAYLRGLEYLSSIYLLSKCDALIAGKNTGSQMAYIFNNNQYEHVYFFELGEYGVDKET